MRTTTTLIIGAGHAGLAMSRRLTERSIDHVVLERGEVANSWRTERWPSLRLLTPNWQHQLPGLAYEGDDPDGYMAVPELIESLTGYAKAISAPVETNTTVLGVRPVDGGYEVDTDGGAWRARSVVVASGACNRAAIPGCAAGVPTGVAMCTPMSYRGAEGLPEGGVLVVGASATGVQLAAEIHESGRPVTLAVGEHVRLPRLHRGRDIFWWMHQAGVLDERYDEVDDIVRARHVPSPQLIGTPQRQSIDLNALSDRGIRLVGRVASVTDGVAHFSGSLTNICKLADLKMHRLLKTIDEWARDCDHEASTESAEDHGPTRVPATPQLSVDLRQGEIGSIVWATGYSADHSWLDPALLDRRGRIRHDGGVVSDAPGMYVLGLTFLRRRRSSFINGASADTEDLSAHLEDYLDRTAQPAPVA